jgi:hypothetical protein
MANKDLPASTKITLMELDYLSVQTVWFNWSAATWYVNFAKVYPLIGLEYLNGISSQAMIPAMGSVLIDGIAATSVATAALVVSTPNSWFFDQIPQQLYVHASDNNDLALHGVSLGVTFGCADQAGYWNTLYYDARLKQPPSLNKAKDPLFFGRIAFGGSSVTLENADGLFDLIAENGGALFGAQVRFLQGFNTDAYASFTRLDTSIVQNVGVVRDGFRIDFIDRRAFLSYRAPSRVFDIGTYPNIKYDNLGKPIPLVYGTVRDMDVTCVDEAAAGTPASFNFKICDCADHAHGIQSIDAVRVDGIAKTPASSSLTAGTFVLNADDYQPGNTVTADIHGFKDGSSALISCASDVILDLLLVYYGWTYISANFNTTEWAAAKTAQQAAFSSGIGLVVKDATEVFAICEQICAATAMNLIPQDSGVFTLRMYDSARTISQTFLADEVMADEDREYDTSQVISSTMVGYNRSWAKGTFAYLHDTSQQAAIYGIYKVNREGAFYTLFTTSADAQAFSTIMLGLAGRVISKFTVKFKMSPLGREVMDFVQVPIIRASRVVQTVIAEVIGVNKTPSKAISLDCRVVRAA